MTQTDQNTVQGVTCIGTGLLTLDVVIPDNQSGPQQVYAGGSCGNVLTILSYLGWRCYPAARLGNDEAGNLVRQEFERFGVSSRFLIESAFERTPIIIEVIRSDKKGQPLHNFRWNCPNCGAALSSIPAPAKKYGSSIDWRLAGSYSILF